MNNSARIPSMVALSVLSCSLAYTSVAETYYLNVSEAGKSSSSWSTTQNWSTVRADSIEAAENAGGKHPPGFDLPDAGFIVPADSGGFTLRTLQGTDLEWNGRYLQLGGVYKNNNSLAVMRLITRNDNKITFNNDGLILGCRSKLQPYTSNSKYNVYGTVTVTADEEDYPAFIRQREPTAADGTYDNMELYFNGKFKGAETSHARIYSTSPGFSVTLADATEFRGTLAATNNLADAATVSLNLGSDFPGTVSISTNVTLIAGAGVKIANLKLYDGAVIDARSGAFSVTGSVVRCGSGKTRVIVDGERTSQPQYMPVFSLPESGDVDAFEFVTESGSVCGEDQVITENGNVNILKFGYVTLQVSDNHNSTKDYQSSMTNGANWSDGLWPTNPLVDYAVIGKSLRTFDSSEDWASPVDHFVFKGRSLVIDGDDESLVVVNPSFRCDNLILRNGADFVKRRYGPSTVLSGTVTVEDGVSTFILGFYERLTLDCRIKGDGSVRLSSHSGGTTGASSGRFTINGLNQEFAGSMTVTIPYYDRSADYSKLTPRFDRNFTILDLTHKLNLGCPLAAVNPKAFIIENMSRVQPDPNVAELVLDEPTRGIFIRWVGRLSAAEGQTFTIASPLAVHGTLWKEGEGTLVLANPAPTFGADALSDDPDSDATNRTFRIAGGDVKISSADAVNGLDVVFTNGAGKLVLDLGSGDGTFRTYGIRNVKSSTPFAVEGDVQEIPVLLTMDDASALPVTCGLFTVAASMRDDALDCLSFEKSDDLAGVFVERKWRENEDGTWTLVATVRKVGTRIIVR